MDKLLLYFNKKTNNYYIKFNNNKCNKCNCDIYGIAKHIINYNKNKFNEYLLHTECYLDIILNDIQQERLVIINNVIPEDSFPIIDTKPQLKTSNLTIYDIKEIDKEYKDSPNETINNSGITYESFEGLKIGNYVDNDREIEFKDIKKELKRWS